MSAADGTATGAVGIAERLLTPGEVAALFRVDPRTATRWGASGKLGACRTPGGRIRFRESAVAQQLGSSVPLSPATSAGKAHP